MAALGITSSDDLLTVTRQWSAVIVHGLSGGKHPNQLGTIQLLTENTVNRNRSQALKSLYRTSRRELVKAFAEAEQENRLVTDNSAYPLLAPGLSFLNEFYKKNNTKINSQHFAISPKELQEICRNNCFSELADLAGSLFIIVSEGSDNFYRASSYNLISLVVGLLTLIQDKETDEKDIEDKLSMRISRFLQRTGQIRTYPVPIDFSLHEVVGNHEENISDYEDDKSYPVSEQEDQSQERNADALSLIDQLGGWLNQWKKLGSSVNNSGFSGLSYPPFVWSRIWQRFYYTLNQQDKNFEPNQRLLGEMIHRQLVAFLNAVLVEEQRYLDDFNHDAANNQSSLQQDNPTLSDDIYRKNLGKLIKSGASAPLYFNLAACPIWYPFLSPTHHSQLQQLLAYYPGNPLLYEQLKTNQEKPLSAKVLFKLDDRTGLYDLLNLIPPARSSDKTTPTLWKHDLLADKVLKDRKIKSAVRKLLKESETSENPKLEKEFVTKHLARTSSKKIEEAISGLRQEPQ